MEGQEVVKVKKKRAKYEVVIILLVIVAAVVIAFGISRAQSKAEKGKLLITEIEQIRAAITTYVTLNKTNPSDLASLTKMAYNFSPGEAPRTYLANVKLDDKGKIVDPFGNPYEYDSKSGRVASATKGFEKW